ncbi:MAG: biotin/lipoyl-containing protein [Gemmatimonadales bacterium]
MKYFVSIAGKSVAVEVNGDRVSVDGREVRAELRQVPGIPVRNLLVEGSSWIVPMQLGPDGKWLLQRRGDRFEVEIVDERTHHVRSLVGGGKGHARPAELKAPMPGLVAKILVEEGQEVAAGQGLVVLEAMKMENELKAPAAGVVASVRVKPGQPVEKGVVLVAFAE